MTTTSTKISESAQRGQATRSVVGMSKAEGFTLVELAIVMIIIGLLIGGILKGQELIRNAQVAATLTQVSNYDAGIGQFRDSYAAFPGDMIAADAAARIPNCPVATCPGGNGNGRWEVAVGAGAMGTEAGDAFIHLVNAGTIAGLPAIQDTPVDGFFSFGRHNGGALAVGGGPASPGNYVGLTSNPAGTIAAAAADAYIDPNQAARMDRKKDDGAPATGTVQAQGSCIGGGLYLENTGVGICAMAIGMSN